MGFTSEQASAAGKKSLPARLARRQQIRDILLSNNKDTFAQIAGNQVIWEHYVRCCIKLARKNPSFLARLLEYCTDRAYGQPKQEQNLNHKFTVHVIHEEAPARMQLDASSD